MSRQKVLHQRQVLPGLLMVQIASHPAPEARSDFDHYGCSKCKKKPHGCARCKDYANQGHAGYFWLNGRQVARKIPTG